MPRFVRSVLAALALGALAPGGALAADETSSGDKLRILHSSRFTFTDSGDPLVTIEIMGGQRRVTLFAPGGLDILPDGEGGARVAGGERWTVTLDRAQPARSQDWIVVERHRPEPVSAITRAVKRWRARGHVTRTFETGSLFAVDGEVMDGRDVLIAIDPQAPGDARAHANALSRKHNIKATLYRELTRRPLGTVKARSGSTVVENPSVLWFSARRKGQAIVVEDVITGHGGSQLSVERKQRSYLGRVYVTVGRDGMLSAVNAISAETMLAGLVPAEIFPSSPHEALKAQAIAARTELLQMIGTRHLDDPFLLCSSQHCQVYAGAGREHPRTTKAINATRGTVLMRENGRLIDARYSASCGGHGEHNDNIWGGEADPALRGAYDGVGRGPAPGKSSRALASFLSTDSDGSYCSKSGFQKGRHRWRETIDAVHLSKRVAAHHPSLGRIVAIEPMRRGVSGRVLKVRVRGQRGSQVITGDVTIRRLFGGLKSTLFQVQTTGPKARPTSFTFVGAGFGHGVGMCQLGAIGMAKAKKTAKAILRTYYAGSRLRRLY